MKTTKKLKKIWQAFILLFAATILVPGAYAQETRKLSLSESIQLSILANKNLRISKAQIEAANARLSQAKDRMLPAVGISGSYYRLSKPDITLGSGLKGLISGSSQSTSTTTTTTVSPAKTSAGFPNINQATLAQASLSEPVFSGFRIKYGIESDKYLLKAAELNSTHVQSEVAINTLAAFYNIYKLQANKRLLQQDLEEQNRRVHDFSNLERNGLLTRNDLLKAEVQQSNIKLSVLDVSNTLDISLYNFRVMLGLTDSASISIDTTQIFSAHSIKSRDEYLSNALSNRRDLQAYAQQNESFNSNVKVAKSGYYPSVALSGGFIDAWIPNFITAQNVLSASLGVRYNLTGIFTTKHQVQEAKAVLLQGHASYDQLSDNIRMAVNQDYLNYNESLQKIEVTTSTIGQASENYRITKNKYTNSLSTLTDLLDADVALLQTKINDAAAKADAEVAWFRLLESSGEQIIHN